ncbi:uncharacterized protein LOC128956496 [Oppia nitens]|uniref:uncharacterized protein LOC128956496 n=1 Tax=Oppia nitens TaxID=1686743 RepID=UPI0023DBDC20|nr:uncharacterized protein LOC128956496 [Oppia nitens]
MCSMSAQIITKLESVLNSWDDRTSCIGAIFSKQLWQQYDSYLSKYSTILNLLKDKQDTEDEFLVICRLHKGAAKHRLNDLLHLPLDRIAQYDKYLQRLANKTSRDHPDYTDICSAALKSQTMMKQRTDSSRLAPGGCGESGVGNGSDLDRIQELFPSDNLRLHETDPLSPIRYIITGLHGIIHKIGGSSASSHHTNKQSNKHNNNNQNNNNNNNNTNNKLDYNSDNCVNRYFIMDGPVLFTIGVQSQERHLFLFNDLMLIAKSRSSGNYKLKEKCRVSEMWLSKTSIDDVCESTKSSDTSFVMGWPTTNVVATFSSAQSKELWHERIQQSISKIKDKEGKSNTTIQVSYWDPVANEDKYTLVKVTNQCTTRDTIDTALREFGCTTDIPTQSPTTETSSADLSADYQLWVKTSRDDTPYPLVGHEYPFAIKMNFVRDLLHRSNLDLHNFNTMAADNKCIFILRRSYPKTTSTTVQQSSPVSGGHRNRRLVLLDSNGKTQKSKSKRRPINWPFKRISLHKSVSTGAGLSDISSASMTDSGICSGSEPSSPTKGKLFGQHLDLLCNDDDDGQLPKPIMNMLHELIQKGPYTLGIFRKSANARVCKEFRAKLETETDPDVGQVPVIVVASVFKEFLRSLPDCLLQSQLYPQWIDAINSSSGGGSGVGHHQQQSDCRERVSRLLAQLPAANLRLLKHVLCLLWHIQQQSGHNKMCSVNLGVCVGQSLLTPNPFGAPNPVPPSTQRCEEMSKQVPKLIAYLIDHCPDLFGGETLRLLGGPVAQSSSPSMSTVIGVDADPNRQDSGAEESDSLNSLPDSNNSGSGVVVSGGGGGGVGTGALSTSSSSSTGSDGGNNHHRSDDSSIDSLERALMDDSTRGSPGVTVEGRHTGSGGGGGGGGHRLTNKMSLSNLSRDSGLTLSDTQLYTDDVDIDDDDDDDMDDHFPSSGGGPQSSYPYMTKSVPHMLDQTGLSNNNNNNDPSDINVTFSYGRSVGVSIDGSCHDVVMRKRRQHLGLGGQHTGADYHHQQLQQQQCNNRYHHNQYRHSAAPGGYSPANYGQQSAHPHNHHNYRHNNNQNSYYRQSSVPSTQLSVHNHSNGYHNHHYSSHSPGAGGHHNHHHNLYHQHIPIHYSKSYSYGINGDISGNDDQTLNNNDNNNDDYGRDYQREYRYRRPPLAAVLGGAPVVVANGHHHHYYRHGYHDHHHEISDQYLRRTTSEESLVRSYGDTVDADMTTAGNGGGYSSLQYSAAAASPVHQKQSSSTYYNNNNTSAAATAATQVTFRADVHHYTNNNNNTSHTTTNNGGVAKVASSSSSSVITTTASNNNNTNSDTASQRSSLSSSRLSSSSSLLRNSSVGSGGGGGSGIITCPPSYQETMTRKEILCRAQSSTALNVSNGGGSNSSTNGRKTSSASTNSSTNAAANSSPNHIYEESVRVYNSDIDNKRNVTHRAVPARVAPIGGNNSDNNNSLVSVHKQTVQRAASDGHSLMVTNTAGARVVRISAQQQSSSPSSSPYVYHTSAQQTLSTPPQSSSSSAANVSFLQRSAKDCTPEEWRKDIPCNVATLRKLFTPAAGSGSSQSSQSGSPSPTSQSCSSSTSVSPTLNQTPPNKYNIYVRQSGRPISVLIETTGAHNNNKLSHHRSIHESTNNNNNGQPLKGVTVVHVGQQQQSTGAAPPGGQLLTTTTSTTSVLHHKRTDSIGNSSSSEEESYV